MGFDHALRAMKRCLAWRWRKAARFMPAARTQGLLRSSDDAGESWETLLETEWRGERPAI